MSDVRSFGHGVAVVVVAAMSPTKNEGHYRPEIDGLRCIAVIGVLLCHYNIRGFEGGFAGVDVFFVISGYLITGMIMRDIELGTFNFRNFYTRRARRLLPALFFTLLSSLFVAALLFSPERMREFAISLIAASLSASNFLFWSQAGYFDASSSLKPLLHTWSLGVEEQFYLLWPLALVVMSRRRISVQSTLLVLFCASLAASDAWQDHTSTIFYLLPFRIFEFAMGGLTLLLEARLTLSNSARELSAFTGCAMIIASYLVFNEKSHFPSFPALLPCAGAALVSLGGSATRARSVQASSPARPSADAATRFTSPTGRLPSSGIRDADADPHKARVIEFGNPRSGQREEIHRAAVENSNDRTHCRPKPSRGIPRHDRAVHSTCSRAFEDEGVAARPIHTAPRSWRRLHEATTLI